MTDLCCRIILLYWPTTLLTSIVIVSGGRTTGTMTAETVPLRPVRGWVWTVVIPDSANTCVICAGWWYIYISTTWTVAPAPVSCSPSSCCQCPGWCSPCVSCTQHHFPEIIKSISASETCEILIHVTTYRVKTKWMISGVSGCARLLLLLPIFILLILLLVLLLVITLQMVTKWVNSGSVSFTFYLQKVLCSVSRPVR